MDVPIMTINGKVTNDGLYYASGDWIKTTQKGQIELIYMYIIYQVPSTISQTIIVKAHQPISFYADMIIFEI